MLLREKKTGWGVSWRENGGGTRRRRKRSRTRRGGRKRARYADKDAHTIRAREREGESRKSRHGERHNRPTSDPREERREGGGAQA